MLSSDSASAIRIANKNALTQRTRHIRTRYHHVREKVTDKTIWIRCILGSLNLSDLFTKTMTREKLDNILNTLNVR